MNKHRTIKWNENSEGKELSATGENRRGVYFSQGSQEMPLWRGETQSMQRR